MMMMFEKLEECPNCGEVKRWAYDGQTCNACGYPAPPRKNITIGMETLRRLARGEAVVIDGVALFAADDFPAYYVFDFQKCVVTGYPAGSQFACGDCDPCSDPFCWTDLTRAQHWAKLQEDRGKGVEEIAAQVMEERNKYLSALTWIATFNTDPASAYVSDWLREVVERARAALQTELPEVPPAPNSEAG